MTTSWIFLICSTICNSAASVLIKIASNQMTNNTSIYSFLSIPLLTAISLFGLNLICYLFALKNIPLFVAYPFVTGITMLTVTLYTKYVFNTPVDLYDTIGISLIFLGILILSKTN